MKGIVTTSVVAEFEIEEHVAKHNRFFKSSMFTLDDLDVYAEPFKNALQCVYAASEGRVTDDEVVATIQTAIADLRALHAAMDIANAA